MEKRDILESLINYYCDGNKARFAAKIGVKPQTINTWISRNSFDVDIIYSKCEEVSGDYLLSGKGDIKRKDCNLNPQAFNSELLQVCKSLIDNYQERDKTMHKLISMVKQLE